MGRILDAVVSGAWVCALGTHKPNDNGCVAGKVVNLFFDLFWSFRFDNNTMCLCVIIGSN